MDYWFKSEKHKITQDVEFDLQDAIKTVLRDGKSMANVSLYKDANSFYIKSNSKISLNHFLFQHGFEELEDELVMSEMILVNS